ncbi:hypothetical protein MYCTH_2304104 [Thermothelomyces thermophilus ATCC 42464]|uniref:Aminoglycoside phosphotransferase domain-containing protein n=1 Tax=Thermothelomyces thermophilus (strain ATCC 42464 / BCRC 31852 / DSM 1799) TaxID=573729 RepID=G2QE85_THET4|nr:uncharacterized protein MYCTH_2304104 [Thermothelomyces thermophilus ATCC 42464]AEO57668.1 hypothetical protein MYCTH_2304104 [Thermothelomyces thermophilus ATCC 42464]
MATCALCSSFSMTVQDFATVLVYLLLQYLAMNLFAYTLKPEDHVERRPKPNHPVSQPPPPARQDEPQPPISTVTRAACLRYAQRLYPGATILEAEPQGRCSYTLFLPPDDRHSGTILQFRPPRHRIDLCITAAAETIFGNLVPHTEFHSVLTPCQCQCQYRFRGPRSSHCSPPSSSSSSSPSSSLSSSSSSSSSSHPHQHRSRSRSRSHEVSRPSHGPGGRCPHKHQDGASGTVVLYTHSLLPGTPLSTLLTRQQQQRRRREGGGGAQSPGLELVVRALARRYFAPSYRHALAPDSPRLPAAKRAVGWSLRRAVARLAGAAADGLPGAATAAAVAAVTAVGGWLEEVEHGLPWALTHGDLVGGGNLLVSAGGGGGGDDEGEKEEAGYDEDKDDGQEAPELTLTGLVDWAEGEWLPFGVGLYGLEEVLGRTVTDEETGSRRFEYFSDAERLRAAFWDELVREVPALAPGTELRERVEKARLLGLLLWSVTPRLFHSEERPR